MRSTPKQQIASIPVSAACFLDTIRLKWFILGFLLFAANSAVRASFDLNAWAGPSYTNDSPFSVNVRIGGYLFDHFNGWYTFSGDIDIGRVEGGDTISLFNFIHATSYMWSDWDNFWWNMSEYDFWPIAEISTFNGPSPGDYYNDVNWITLNLRQDDLRRDFLGTQAQIVGHIAGTSSSWSATDREWVNRVVDDFMTPLISAMNGNPNPAWSLTMNSIAQSQGDFMTPWFMLNGAASYAMATTHIQNDLRTSLINNGVGSDAAWAAIGQIINNSSQQIYGVIQAVAGNLIVEDMRENMRNELKAQGVDQYR